MEQAQIPRSDTCILPSTPTAGTRALLIWALKCHLASLCLLPALGCLCLTTAALCGSTGTIPLSSTQAALPKHG